MDQESKNKDFVQVYRRHIDDIARLAKENGKAYDLFMFLIKHMDGSNALCVSTAVLAELMETSTRTIMRAVKYLKEKGWLCVLKSGTTNVYIVNPEIVWTSYADQKCYCKFETNVILSSTENAEYLKNPKAMTHFKTVDSDFIKSVQTKRQKFINDCNNISNQID